MADIDFANSDSRMSYLKENLGHLMNGIDKNYGQVLMDELMNRLEQTVSDFNEEVKAMLGQLQGIKMTPRDNILASKPSKPAPKPAAFSAPPPPPPPPAMPAVELPADDVIDDLDAKLDLETEPDFAKPVKEVEIDLPEMDSMTEFERRLKQMENE